MGDGCTNELGKFACSLGYRLIRHVLIVVEWRPIVRIMIAAARHAVMRPHPVGLLVTDLSKFDAPLALLRRLEIRQTNRSIECGHNLMFLGDAFELLCRALDPVH